MKELSILVSKYGLSFIIYKDRQKKFFEYLFAGDNPVVLKTKLEEIITERAILNDQYEQIKLIYHNRLNALVPNIYFTTETARKWLEHHIKLLPNDMVAYDFIETLQAYNVYVPFQNLDKSFSQQTSNLIVKHSGTIFFNDIEQLKNQTQNLPVFEIFINVFPGDFQIAIFKNESLQAYNHFEYENIEEFLYFLFFMTETLEAKPQQSHLYIFGTGDKAILYENLSLFTKNIHFIPEKNSGKIYNNF